MIAALKVRFPGLYRDNLDSGLTNALVRYSADNGESPTMAQISGFRQTRTSDLIDQGSNIRPAPCVKNMPSVRLSRIIQVQPLFPATPAR